MPRIVAGDIRMHYEAQGSGPPLVLLMGLGCPGALWFQQVEGLSSRFRVITPDNRGIGRSDKPAMDYSIEMFADDTDNLLRALGIGKAHILGMSMGGAIAQQFALRHPEMVDKLVLSCTWNETGPYGLVLMETWRTMAEKGGMAALAKLTLLQSLTPRCFGERPELVERLLAIFSEHPQPVTAYVRQNWACVWHNTTKLLPQIKAPTLFLVGDKDVQTPIGSSKFMARQIPGAKLVVMEGLGHGLMWEAPDKFNGAVAEFLAGS